MGSEMCIRDRLDVAYISEADLKRYSENWMGSIIGHENVHGGQGYFLRGRVVDPFLSEEERRYWNAVIELQACEWQLENWQHYCLSEEERRTLSSAIVTYEQTIYEFERGD